MLRELTSIMLAAFLIFYLIQIAGLGSGAGSYDAFISSLRSPGMLLFHLIALIAAIYHTVTWLQLTGVVTVLRLGDRVAPPGQLVWGGYLVWVAVSLVVFLILVL
jgi:fumarate reductase subunit C